MSVSPTSKTLNIGETVQLTGTKNPTSASEGTQWTSSNTGVATVSGSGLVTAKAAGTATITFKNSSSTKSASCKITVQSENIIAISNWGMLIKYNSDGTLVWKKGITRTTGSYDIDYNDKITHFAIMPDKNIIILTYYGWLLKYNSDGTLVWKKGITRTTGSYDIDYNDKITHVSIMPDKNIIILTYYGWLIKYNSDGTLVWKKGITRTTGSYDIDYNDKITHVSIMPDKNIIILTYYGWLIKYNSDGTLVWKKGITRTTGSYDIDYNTGIYGLSSSDDGNIIVTSSKNVLKYDNNGSLISKEALSNNNFTITTSYTLALILSDKSYIAYDRIYLYKYNNMNREKLIWKKEIRGKDMDFNDRLLDMITDKYMRRTSYNLQDDDDDD